jgi:hypothetical protein
MRVVRLIAVASMLALSGGLGTPASARVGVLQAPAVDAVALAGAGVVVAPAQRQIELVAPGAAPRVLAHGPGLGGVSGSTETATMLQFAASAQAFAYESASLGFYHGDQLSFADTTGFGALNGPYSAFPGEPGAAACNAGYPGGAFAPRGAQSGPFTIEGTRLAAWPSCTSANAVLVRNLRAPADDLQVKLPDLGSPDETGGAPDEVGAIALAGEMLAVLVGTSNADGAGPLAPEFLCVENIATGKGSACPLVPASASAAIAVGPEGTAVIQIPGVSSGGHLSATTYLATPGAAVLQPISTGCVSAYGVKLAAGRVAQAVCGRGIVTINLTGEDPETVLALGGISVNAFDYDGSASAAVRPLCDGRDEVELAGVTADSTPPPPASCPARLATTRARVVHGAVQLELRCAQGCAGDLALSRGRLRADAHFAVLAPGGTVLVQLPRALREAASGHDGALFAATLTVRALTGGATRARGRVRIDGQPVSGISSG